MKKLFSVFIILLSAIILFPGATFAKASSNPEITAKSAYLADFESGTEIFSKNPKERLTIASMTKIMLLNLCFEKIENGELSFDEEITVSKNASGMGGSQVFLDANKNYKAFDLIKSIAVASANDASVAMAERLYGTEENCVEAMNEKCSEWGLNDTLFSNCTGLPKPTQYSCAKDVAYMLKKLVSHEDYFKVSTIWMDEIKHDGGRVTGINNTNKLIRFYDGCDGGKTGYTAESGFCLAATAKRGSMRLISVIIKASDGKTRFAEASNLFNYGFDNYCSKMVIDKTNPMDISVEVNKGKEGSVKIIPEENVFIFSARNLKDNVTIDFIPTEKITAPIKRGDIVGTLTVYKDNVEYAKVNALSAEDVDKKIYFDYIKDIGSKWKTF